MELVKFGLLLIRLMELVSDKLTLESLDLSILVDGVGLIDLGI